MSIYLDNAATSLPKHESVYKAVSDTLRKYGSSPGRGGHKMSLQTERIIFDVRERIASFFNIPNSSNVIFTFNVTMGINLALKGFLKAGDHVLTSSMEHNAVMRPLKRLEKEGAELFSQAKKDEAYIIHNLLAITKIIYDIHSPLFGIFQI